MVTLHLTEDRAALLREVLESALSELRDEIAHTDTLEYRTLLRDRRRMLEDVLRSLEPRPVAPVVI